MRSAFPLPLLIALALPVAQLPGAAIAEVTPDLCQAAIDRLGTLLRKGKAEFSARYAGLDGGICDYRDVMWYGGGRFDPEIRAGKMALSGSILDWMAGKAPAPSTLGLELEGLRLVARTGDERMDYLFEAQSRSGEMALSLQAQWLAEVKELEISSFELDLAGDSKISLGARAKNVDLSGPGAMQMALTGFALTDLRLEVRSFGLFEQYILPAVISGLPEGEGDFATQVAAKKREARSLITALPAASFSENSKAALAALISDLPNPRGKLLLDFRSGAGFGPARLARFALTGLPGTMKEAEPLFQDTQFDIEWRRGERD